VVISALVILVIEASLSTTTCDEIEMQRLKDVGNQRSCVKQSSPITSPDLFFVDPTESNITVFYFFRNKQLFYLPVQVYKAAPNLLMIDAPYSEIKAISKKNFEKLTKLEFLWLHFNKIATIPPETFADLVSLKKISLGE
jgi:Leucine-rich repeat (LRR) protein